MDAVPGFKFGHVEKPQRGLGLDAMFVVQDAQNFVHVVDPAFTRSPTGENITHGFGGGAVNHVCRDRRLLRRGPAGANARAAIASGSAVTS